MIFTQPSTQSGQPYLQPETQLLFKHMTHDARTQKRSIHIMRRAYRVGEGLEVPEALIGIIRYSNATRQYIYELRKDMQIDLTTNEYAEIQAELDRCKELMRVGKLGMKLTGVMLDG